jgi:phosphoribosylanthranilate isomerase
VIVKICGLTTEADALLAVGLGADALGFIMAPSPRQVSVSTVADIVKRLPQGVMTVGVFRDESPQRVTQIANHIGLAAVQLHGHETPSQTRWVGERVATCIKAFSAGDPAIGRFDEFGADYLLVDGASPGSGEVFDWRLAEGVVDPSRLIVSGGLTPDNVGQAIAHLHPFGVDVATGVESEPGRKDPKLVGAFVTAARAAAVDVLAARGLAPVGDDDEEQPGMPGAGVTGDAPYDWMER